jgi:tRNA(Ile)-lysidine synthase
MNLPSRVLDTIRRHELMRRGDRVLVALSGGPDSVALLRLLRELESGGELTVAGAAHLNHALRDTAHRDEQFSRALAAEVGVPFRSDRVEVRELATRRGTSLEDAGRRARYELFERAADELGADVIATGHTRDDQAETFLLRLIRGAGARGLAGIHPRMRLPAEAPEARRWSLPAEAPEARRWVVRPLIEIGRSELREYLARLGQAFCDDESNRDLSFPRNRIRHELLPLIEREFNPRITDVLAREAAVARADEDRLQQEAIDLADSIVLRSRTADIEGAAEVNVAVDARALASLHPALAVRVGRLALGVLAPDRFVSYEHAERLLELARGSSGALSLPGQHAERRGDHIVLSRTPFQPFANSFHVSLSIPGEVTLAAQGWAISATWGTGTEHSGKGGWHLSGKGASHLLVGVAANSLVTPLVVRSRRPGDWFRPLGMGGQRKKLQDFLVDRKIARERRDSLPLVVDSADRIVWVVGESVSEDFQVTEPSRGVILLKARRLGGQG